MAEKVIIIDRGVGVRAILANFLPEIYLKKWSFLGLGPAGKCDFARPLSTNADEDVRATAGGRPAHIPTKNIVRSWGLILRKGNGPSFPSCSGARRLLGRGVERELVVLLVGAANRHVIHQESRGQDRFRHIVHGEVGDKQILARG